jgi:hypothetical protein
MIALPAPARPRRARWPASTLAVVALLAAAALPTFAQSVAAPAPSTREAREQFLRTAKVVSVRTVTTGITGTLRATLDDGTQRHDASIQRIDQTKASFRGPKGREFGFRDTWKFNLAAYHLAQMIGLDNVPETVERAYEGEVGSFTWWVDDVLMDEGARQEKNVEPPDIRRWEHQVATMRVFDALIANTDRNKGNLLFDKHWTAWFIDHTRAFRRARELYEPAILVRCERRLLEALRGLDEASLRKRLSRWLNGDELRALIARRDAIVGRFATEKAAAVYDFPDRRP